jgi:hypothetical protein
MKIEINESHIEMLNLLKSNMLLKDHRLFFIDDFTVEDITIEKNWFRKEKTIKCLTNLKVISYSLNNKKECYLDTDNIHWKNAIYFKSCYKWRENYQKLVEQINGMGGVIIDNPEKVEKV